MIGCTFDVLQTRLGWYSIVYQFVEVDGGSVGVVLFGGVVVGKDKMFTNVQDNAI